MDLAGALAVEAELGCEALGNPTVVSIRGDEAMNALVDLRVELRCLPLEHLQDALGKPASLAMKSGTVERSLALWVSEIEVIEEDIRVVTLDGIVEYHTQYAIRLEPAAAAMKQGSGYRMFVKKTTMEIVRDILIEYQLDDLLEERLSGAYAIRPQCVQYDEHDWDFVCRLLADEGVSFWFEQNDADLKFVVADALEHAEPIEGEWLPFCDPSASVTEPHVFELELVDELCIESAHTVEYDIRQPSVLIEGSAGDPNLLGYYHEYPARVLDKRHADDRAQVRVEQLANHQARAKGRSSSIAMMPGRIATVDGVADDAFNTSYLIERVHHEWSGANTGAGRQYENQVSLAQDERFVRPEIPEWPSVATIESAKTTGSEEIVVNDLGDVRLSFPWDRSGISTEDSSWWARSMQMNMGGSMVLPRVGWEVSVMFADGNPDRPIVTGRVYNPNTPVPYPLPENKAVTAMKGESVPEGGAHNEVRFGDTAGDEKVLINAVKDFTHWVGGDRTSKVGQAMTHSTGESRTVQVKADQSSTVGATQELDVGNEITTAISGTRTRMVGGLEVYEVKGDRKMTTVAYTEAIGAGYVLQCNQHNAQVDGAYVQSIAGNANYVAGLGFGETVYGIRFHEIGGSYKIYCKAAYNDNVIGWKTTVSGSCKIDAKGLVSMEASGTGTYQIGGKVVLKAGKNILVDCKGGDVTIHVDKLTTPHGAMNGGKLSSTKGTAKGKGKVVWKGNVEIDG